MVADTYLVNILLALPFLIIVLLALVIAIFWLFWASLTIGILGAILSAWLLAMKHFIKFRHIPDLSNNANILLRIYGYYYMYPGTCQSLAKASSLVQFAGYVLAIVSAFQAFWWGIPVALLFCFFMGIVGSAFNPTGSFTDRQKIAHEEIFAFQENLRRLMHPTDQP